MFQFVFCKRRNQRVFWPNWQSVSNDYPETISQCSPTIYSIRIDWFPSSVAHLFLAHIPWFSTCFIVSFNASSTCLYKVYWRTIPWYGCSIMKSFSTVMTWEQIPHYLKFRITGSYTKYLDIRCSILDISITYSYTWNCYVKPRIISHNHVEIVFKCHYAATASARTGWVVTIQWYPGRFAPYHKTWCKCRLIEPSNYLDIT